MSKFKDILNAAKEREKEPEIKKLEESTSQAEVQSNKRGRPKGKRSDPDYEQVTAYIRRKTYKQTKITLLQQNEVEDFSELIEILLTEWLSTQKFKNSDSGNQT